MDNIIAQLVNFPIIGMGKKFHTNGFVLIQNTGKEEKGFFQSNHKEHVYFMSIK